LTSSSLSHSILIAFGPSTVVGPIIEKHFSAFGIDLKNPFDFLKASVPWPLIICLICEVSMTYLGLGGNLDLGFFARNFH
jgi:hypothetical protein